MTAPPAGAVTERASDAMIAQMLQEEERDSYRRTFRSNEAARPRDVDPDVVESLVERLGVCVICSEAVASVVYEPCGHLCLCGGCHAGWVESRGSNWPPCVLCRTPATNAFQLLPHAQERRRTRFGK